MLKAIIIDDEARARRILEALLEEYCPEVEVLDSVGDVPEAVKSINKHEPNLVFLDIEMPGYNGFQLLEFFGEVNFEIIFVTAYSEYALNAFQVSALDYLLKPIQINLLVKAVEKASQKLENPQFNERVETLKENLKQEFISRVALPIQEGLIFVDVDDIIYLKADGSYTNIFLNDGKTILVSKKLKTFEEVLNHPQFFRPHRSYLINLNHVSQYIRQDGGYIIMDNEGTVDISKDKKNDFLKVYQMLK